MASVSLADVVAGLATFPWLSQGSWKAARKVAKVKTKKNLGLEVAFSPESPEIDICFVHGLTGDARSTWTSDSSYKNEEIFWPTKLLNDQSITKDLSVPQARILLYGYETDVSSLCWLTERTLYHHATHLLKDLINVRKDCEHRPLLFVVHSLGGLLVKSALIFARGIRSQETEDQNIYFATFGVISFGTPHTFAKKGTLFDVMDRLCHTRQFGDHLPKFEDLNAGTWKEDVKDLENKLNKYNVIALEIPEVFCYESSPAQSFTPLCSKNLAVPEKPRFSKSNIVHSLSKGLAIEKDHVNMCKFTTHKNRDFGNVCRSIREFYEAKPSVQQNGTDIFSSEEHSSAGTSEKISSLDFSIEPDLQPRPTYQERRDPDSGEDLLEKLHNRLCTSRLIVLMGNVGYGKSTLALQYAWLQKLRGDRSPFSSIFWLDAANESSLAASFIEMAERLRRHYDSVEHKASLALIQKRPKLGQAHTHTPGAPNLFRSFLTRHRERRVAIRSVFDWLAYPENTRWLLIYDDVDDSHASYLQPFLPPKDLHRGYIIMTSKKDNTTLRVDGQASIHLPRFDPQKAASDMQRSGSPIWLSSNSAENMGTADSCEPFTEFEMMRVGSFNRDESVALIKTKRDSNNTTISSEDDSNQNLYARIAENLYDNPQELDSIQPHLTSVDSAKRLDHELEQGIDRFDEVPVEYREWINMCVMLAYEPIPILLLQLHFKVDREAVLQGLEKLESIVWASIDYTASTFRILSFRRRLRRQVLEGFHNGARNAQMACNAVIEAINHLLTIGQSNAERISTEQVLIKHMDTCVENLTTWRTFMGSDCEWDVLAEFCERAGLYSEAAIFYGSAQGQRIPNSNTRSRVSRSGLSVWSDNAYSDQWYDAESSTSTDVWDDARNSFSMDRSNFPDTTKDTKSSRLLRSEVGLIRMQIHLKQLDGLDGQCQDLLKRTESREKDTYITLRIELFRLIVHLKAAKKDWPGAVEDGHKLLDILQRYYGPFAEETIEAIYQLAKIHMEQEDYAGAEPLLEQVLMIQQQLSEKDENYARMIDIYRDLGRTYKEQGIVIPARECYSWVVETYRRLLGDDHIQTTRAKESLAVIEDMMKRGARGI